MLTEDLKQQIQQAYRAFLDAKGLKSRYGQRQMVGAVARVIGGVEADASGVRQSERHVVLVEAGTGTGKTLAYLLGTIPIAKAASKKLVLSTATVALQEQLLYKDLPDIALHAQLPVKVSLAKGRGRYLCISKAERMLDSQEAMGQIALYEDEQVHKLDEADLGLYRDLLNEFASGRWDGDRDNLKRELEDQLWHPLTSDHLQCTNRRCHNFSACPFYRARESLDQAEVVIANHDLVMADLALGGGAILPDPTDSIYVFDEGHHLAAKAIGHFSYSMRVAGSLRWLSTATRQLEKMRVDCGEHQVLSTYVSRLAQPFVDLNQCLESFQRTLRALLTESNGSPKSDRFRFPNGQLPEALRIEAGDLALVADKAVVKFEQIVELLKEAIDGGIPEIEKDAAERWYPQTGMLLARMQSIHALVRSYRNPDPEGASPTARWINVIELPDGMDFECRSSPVSAATTLSEHLWQHCYGAVVTSATLTALGHFDRVLVDLGLPPDSPCERLQSPFDHQRCAELWVPPMQADPSNPEAHTSEVADFLARRLPEARATLVLFSSWRQMRTVLEQLDDSIKNTILSQGQFSKNEILQQHRSAIDKGARSIIFGLASFAEGVDLPGDYLTEVIIAKLPFSVPDDPVDATMAEWIERQGGNAFIDWSVPMASMRLTQAVGRLLRTEQDSGNIILLDRRVVTKRYGRQLLDALPPFRRKLN
ncbi:ATP-dependent DNA helicase DinG [Marinobacterium rhizophilum]|uniref:ATP-dependent DNA helicase DinG n=1 Tax=Marinobacterium rhizophilum TaxID=420402 RepID=A0ABY5HLM9_9GAMM|nr:ATP-dependent DNA helicase DinG [Marinobacterium rhizophilum]UTW13291.1 ATP-dependent DNA helicase DinG [Marinobacterium rhizophilum]